MKYDQHVDLLYHTANPLIDNQPAVNMTAKNLSKPRRHRNNLKIHTTFCQPPSNSSSDAPITHTVGLNTNGTSPPVSVNNGKILTSAGTLRVEGIKENLTHPDLIQNISTDSDT